MVQWSDEILNDLLAPGISAFDRAEIPDISQEFDQAQHWLTNFFLNSAFGPRYVPRRRQAVVTLLFRTGNAFEAYDLARHATLKCVAQFQPGSPAISLYFGAVSYWESVLLKVQIALNVVEECFDSYVDETEGAVRIRSAANRVKHYGEDIRKKRNGEDLTLPLWLTAEGVRTSQADMQYEEFAQVLREMGRACDLLQRPKSQAT